MSWRSGLASGVLYASLMTFYKWSQDDPFRGSYVLGWLFYAVTFGVLFWVLMNLVERIKLGK